MVRCIALLTAGLLLTAQLVCAEPASTTAFAFIKPLMPQAEVVRRLGWPDWVLQGPRSLVPVWQNGRRELREIIRQTYVYAGDGQIMTSYIRLENGRVVETWKTR